MKQIFINIPVSDLEKSMQFYLALGLIINPLFTDKDQKCMVWSESIYVMLQSTQFSDAYIKKTPIDPRKHQMPSFTLPVGSIEQVNAIIEIGISFGGVEPVAPVRLDYMYLRSIEDPDGYMWGILYLELASFEAHKNAPC
ncbi:MAG: glyoxalase/bleomycin resistance/extradiol dioxygenase family protein [Chitinophagia bacterium]|nr:glyoxalase/bleomycin resistance/extradiol dioxygenase family protein [Chitinophagia bacterium]